MFVSINRHGMMMLRTEVVPQDSTEELFLQLPTNDQKRAIDVILNVQRYIDDPKDDFELELASEYESMPEEQRMQIAQKLQAIVGGYRKLWYRPTLIDTIRICRVGGVNYLPFDLLVKLDTEDHNKKKRYIESNGTVGESAGDHSFVQDMYRLQKQKSHFKHERWTLLTSDFKEDIDLGYNNYVIRLRKNNGTGTNYIFSSGVLFGYDDRDTSLQTVYYIEPCEVIYMLRDGEVIHGDENSVSMRLLSKCLDNLT